MIDKDLDFYPTSQHLIDVLLMKESFNGEIWEPSCGNGIITETLYEKGYRSLYSSDLYERGFDCGIIDFLTSNRITYNIVTNPPYSILEDYIDKCLRVATRKIALLLPIKFLNNPNLQQFFNLKDFKLKIIYVISNPTRLYKNGIEDDKDKDVIYGWFIWDKQHFSRTEIEFI